MFPLSHCVCYSYTHPTLHSIPVLVSTVCIVPTGTGKQVMASVPPKEKLEKALPSPVSLVDVLPQ